MAAGCRRCREEQGRSRGRSQAKGERNASETRHKAPRWKEEEKSGGRIASSVRKPRTPHAMAEIELGQGNSKISLRPARDPRQGREDGPLRSANYGVFSMKYDVRSAPLEKVPAVLSRPGESRNARPSDD